MARIELEILNEHGLHARPGALFVQTAGRFASKITLQNLDRPTSQPIDAKSIMSVLTSGIGTGGRIAVEAHGADEDAAIDALTALVRSGLGERGADDAAT